MSELVRRLRMALPPQPEDEIQRDRAEIKAVGLKVDSWAVQVDKDDEWHTIVYTVSRKRRRRDS